MLGACVFSLCVNHSSQDSKQVKIMCFDIKSMFSLYLLTIPVSAQNKRNCTPHYWAKVEIVSVTKRDLYN